MRLHWHRRDLRIQDNPALSVDDTPVIGCFIIDPAIMAHAGPPRVAFLYEALDSLMEGYRDANGALLISEGNPIDRLPVLVAEQAVDSVSWEADYSGLARRRDREVQHTLDEDGISTRVTHGAVHHEPGTITTAEGRPYRAFRYYGQKWLDREKDGPAAQPTQFADISPSAETVSRLDTPTDLTAELPAAGTTAASDRLETFCDGPIFRYAEDRDVPAKHGTSGLSQDLAFGTIGSREVWKATESTKADAETAEARESVEEFQRQLAWREFYTQVLWERPDTIDQPFDSFEQPIQWREDADGLEAWKRGETGYPIVDAGMRQLREEAWMHNRVRMIVASFLTKDLLIDWREGYRWFRKRLVDHDTANDIGGWQWAASTGTDAQPYFRIFNPMTQGKRYDPNAVYIKRYVPALENVAAVDIHQWDEVSEAERRSIAPEYSAPIVDHADRREEALAMFEAARAD